MKLTEYESKVNLIVSEIRAREVAGARMLQGFLENLTGNYFNPLTCKDVEKQDEMIVCRVHRNDYEECQEIGVERRYPFWDAYLRLVAKDLISQKVGVKV